MNVNKSILIVFFILGLVKMPSFASPFNDGELHAFHISKTDMIFNAKDKTVQITMHIFIDDLEVALEKQGIKGLFIGTEKEKKEANNYICQYLFSHFSIKINNKEIQYEVLGKESTTDRQALYIYMEIKNVKELRNIFVENKVLTEAFSDQKNIVQINVPSKKQGYFLLDKNKIMDSAQF